MILKLVSFFEDVVLKLFVTSRKQDLFIIVCEIMILSGGYNIPRGTNILIFIWNIHRNKETWGSDAEEFKPERFLPEDFENIPTYAFIPFSRGPRVCIGFN